MDTNKSAQSRQSHDQSFWPRTFALWLVDTLAILVASLGSGLYFGLAYGVAFLVFGGLAMAVYHWVKDEIWQRKFGFCFDSL